MNSRRTFRLRMPRIKTKVHAGGAMLPERSAWRKIFSPRCSYFQNFIKVLKIFDFNGAGKQVKRRQWRMQRACFEEGSQTADTQYPLFGLSRRCIPSWVSASLR